MSTEYEGLLRELRHRYETKYGKILDDEVLYMIIRMNELQVDIKRDIKKMKKPALFTGKEVYLYGLGRITHFSLIACVAFLLSFSILFAYKYSVRSPTPPSTSGLRVKEDSLISTKEEKKVLRKKDFLH